MPQGFDVTWEGRRYVGFSELARILDERAEPAVYRQLVYNWWKRRHATGFPERVHVPVKRKGVFGDAELFDVQLVQAWYDDRIAHPPPPGWRPDRARAA